MKILYALMAMVLLAFAVPVQADENTTNAFTMGIAAGQHLSVLGAQAVAGNVTAALEYNAIAQALNNKYNATMSVEDAAKVQLKMLPIPKEEPKMTGHYKAADGEPRSVMISTSEEDATRAGLTAFLAD